jgi:hypothetical protein
MALRLRRGTDAERLLITPVEGELIYTTDTKKLYAGDGSTAGGNIVTGSGGGGGGGSTTLDGLTDTDLTSVGNSDVLTYNGSTSKWEPAPVPGIGVITLNTLNDVNTAGTIVDDLLQYDGVHYVPKSISEIITDDTIVNSMIADASIGTLQLADGNTYDGTHIGSFDGDLKGSVFGEDSSILVDAIGSVITGNVDNTAITSTEISLAGTDAGIKIVSDQNADDNFSLFDIKVSKDGDVGSSIVFSKSRGTPAAPTALQDEDEIMGINYFGYDSNNNPQVAAVIQVAVQGTVGANAVPGSILLATSNAAGTPTPALLVDSNQATNFQGAATLKSYADNTARDAAITSPTAGMMIYNATGTKFQGYNGSAWVDLN